MREVLRGPVCSGITEQTRWALSLEGGHQETIPAGPELLSVGILRLFLILC